MNSTTLASKLGRLLKLLVVSIQVNPNSRGWMRFGKVWGLATLFYLVLPIAVQAQYTYTTNADNTLTITRYTGASASVSIPTNINGKTVTHIGDEVFYQNTYMTTVVIPGTVNSIGIRAFYSCTNLNGVAIPNSVTNVSNNAFEWCSRMTNLTIGSGITAIEDYTFRNCTNLLSVTIPSGVISIGNTAFGGCGLTNIVFGSGVKRIGDEAFEACNRLASVTIPNNVTNIGFSAFLACFNLKNVMIGNGVKSIGIEAFSSCIVLTNVVIGSGVTSIGNVAFEGCNSLSSVTIPNSVTSIGGGAFGYCSTLKSVTIPNSVTNLGGGAFQNCYGLTNVVIGSGVTSIGDGTFSSCNSLASVTIPSNVTSIGEQAFSSCTVLTNVVIGSSVTNIGRSAFAACTILKNITVPDNVTSIEDSAFYGCSGLTNAVIGNGVTNIGITAFYNCIGLRSIVIGNRVTNVGDSAFFGDGNLAGVYFRGNAPSVVGANLFSGCTISIVYRLSVATGWPTVPNLWAGRPTALWSTNSLAINPASTNLSSSASTGRTIGVTANVAWTATTNMPWIVITAGASGTSNGTVTFSVAINSTSSRTGGIVVAGGGISLTCIVVQAGISAPSSPTGISATDGTYPDQVQVFWSASSGATGYEVWRFTSNNSNSASRIAQVISGLSYDDTNVTAGTVYYYWLKATNASGVSSFSLSDLGYASNSVPLAPTSVSATDGTYPNQVQVSWSASSGATGYEVWRFTNSNSSLATNIAQGLSAAPYNDTNVTVGLVYFYWLKATNASGASALSSSDSGYAQLVAPPSPIHYVSLAGLHMPPFTNWATASTNIQSAVNATIDGDLVLVTNGTYGGLGGLMDGTNVVVITNAITLQSVNGASQTIIDGGNLYRCLYVSNAVVDGFTIRNGKALGSISGTGLGGGISALNGSRILNCSVVSNQGSFGGGVFSTAGSVSNCIIEYNSGGNGGGLRSRRDAESDRCIIRGNSASESGAGVWINNGAKVRNALIVDNVATGNAGGVMISSSNCLIESCTISRNEASVGGGLYCDAGTPGSAVQNTIIYFNTATSNGPNHWILNTNDFAAGYSCTVPAWTNGNENITNDPQFVASGDYRLGVASPCIDAGTNLAGGMKDLDGIPRPLDGNNDGTNTTDMGCYEFVSDSADSDGDGMPDGDEILAGSNPTNGESMFGFADSQPVPEGGGVVVSWPSLSNRVYRLERSTNLLLDFEPLANDLPAHPPVNSYTDQTPNVLGAYKVGVRME